MADQKPSDDPQANTRGPRRPTERGEAEIKADLAQARDLIKDGERDKALQICVDILANDELTIPAATVLSQLLRVLHQTDAADEIKSALIQGIRDGVESDEQTVNGLIVASEALTNLDQYEDAEKLCQRALEIDPTNISAITGYCALLNHLERADEALKLIETYLEDNSNEFELSIHFVKFFTHFQHDAGVQALLERAERSCKTSAQRAKLDYQLAARGQSAKDLDQHSMVVNLFDSFADTYDSKLESLGNNGPSMVYSVLQELELPEKQTRRILDAGCGTGLCAGFLRNYAKEIVGVDLSVHMLEKAKEKQVYDFLARTDLSIPATYPEGTFDMIVCSDVLVYVGALESIFQNLHNVLNPGGWFIVTVETEIDDDLAPGYKLYASGRHKHTDAYLIDTLAKCGFPKPKLLKHARIRDEMAEAILGTVFAVQKPAIFAF